MTCRLAGGCPDMAKAPRDRCMSPIRLRFRLLAPDLVTGSTAEPSGVRPSPVDAPRGRLTTDQSDRPPRVLRMITATEGAAAYRVGARDATNTVHPRIPAAATASSGHRPASMSWNSAMSGPRL